jgi:hypothetical protein
MAGLSMEEGDKGDTVLSRRRAAALIWVWSMRPLLGAEIKGQAGRRGPPKGLSVLTTPGLLIMHPNFKFIVTRKLSSPSFVAVSQ